MHLVGIRKRKSSERAGADPGIRPRGHWGRQEHYLKKKKSN